MEAPQSSRVESTKIRRVSWRRGSVVTASTSETRDRGFTYARSNSPDFVAFASKTEVGFLQVVHPGRKFQIQLVTTNRAISYLYPINITPRAVL
jgi:hypothetical protein